MTFFSNTPVGCKAKYTLLIWTVMFGFFSCTRPPEYSEVPEITFNDIEYRPAPKSGGIPTGQDSIIVRVDFKDGDGDLGLDEDQNETPFQEFNYLLNSDKTDTLRLGDAGMPDFNFYDYSISENNEDTFRVDKNPYHYNFLVEFYVENGAGEYIHQEYRSWCINSNVCIPFHGRFEPLSDKGRPEPLEGTISFTMQSFGFPKGNLKFDIAVYDRALHKSNVVRTSSVFIP